MSSRLSSATLQSCRLAHTCVPYSLDYTTTCRAYIHTRTHARTHTHTHTYTHRFKKIYTGKSQLHTQHIPRGIVGEFDIMTCRDLGNGEVQYFRIRYD